MTKFLLDVCVSSRSLEASLVAQGHDVLSALAVDPKASDERLMAVALEDDRVLVTEDKDFGELDLPIPQAGLPVDVAELE